MNRHAAGSTGAASPSGSCRPTSATSAKTIRARHTYPVRRTRPATASAAIAANSIAAAAAAAAAAAIAAYPELGNSDILDYTPKVMTSWGEFEGRLDIHLKRLDALQVNYRRADGTPAVTEHMGRGE